MRNLKITILFLLLSIASFSQVGINLKSTPYVNPQTLGQYPLVSFDYVGEIHNSINKTFTFVFVLSTDTGDVISNSYWKVTGDTPVENTIKNHGLLTVGENPQTDFITYVIGGGDLYAPDLVIDELPELSYEDIVNYFILGGKMDKIQLPANSNARALVKWLLEETLLVNGEKLNIQFTF